MAPSSEITLTSTTDTPEEVAKALGITLPPTPAADDSAEEVIEPEETADEDEDEDDADEAEGKAEKPAKEEVEGKDKKAAKPSRKEERISKLTWEKHQLRYQNEQLEQQLEALKKPAAPATEAVVDPTKPAKFAEARPKVGDFETTDAFLDAVADWTDRKVEFTLAAQTSADRARVETEQQTRSQDELTQAHLARIEEFRTTHPDFDTLAQQAIEDELPLTPIMTAHFQHSDMGPAIMYHLAQNPDECRRIAALKQGPCLVALGELQAELRRASPAAAKPAEKKAATAPAAVAKPAAKPVPKPITPVGGGATETNKDPGSMPYQEYKKWRANGGGRG